MWFSDKLEMEKAPLISHAEITDDSCSDLGSEDFEIEKLCPTPHTEITEDSTSGNKSDWVVELEKDLIKEVNSSGGSSPVFFTVAKAFLDSDKQYYIPKFISVGPYHLERLERSSIEPHKTEAVRRMQQRIHKRSMRSIVETDIVAMDKSTRDLYDKELSHSAIDLAWIVTKDSCFLFEFMLNFLRKCQGKHDYHNDCVVEGRYDALLSSSLMNPTWKNILHDLVLFENQIPLSVLEHLLAIADFKRDPDKILGDILSEVAKRYSILVFRWGMPRPYKKQKALHFLEVLYYRHVGWDLSRYKQKAYSVKDGRLWHFGWIKSVFICCFGRSARGRGVEGHVLPFRVKLPSAAELNKKGVNFCLVTPTNSAIAEHPESIRWVRFEEKTSTLYLPEVRIDHFRHALLRNFIALESTTGKYPFPITSFAFFMDELVDSEEDVAVLREENIIKNFFGSNKEAAECFNALTRSYHVGADCKPIDDARVGLHKYLKRKYKILWNEFIATYFAKPWLVVGSVVAVLLLLMTVVQVFCLFYTCNRSS